MMRVRDRRRWPRFLRGAVTALAPPGVVTLGALLADRDPDHDRRPVLRPRGRVATADGRLVPGLVASVASFLALNFFFTPPFHTFAVEETADLVALAVFLAVSATVGHDVLPRARATRASGAARARGPAAPSSGHAPPLRRADGRRAPEPRPVDPRALRPRSVRDHQRARRHARSSPSASTGR